MNNIIVERRASDFIAYLFGEPTICGSGTAPYEAIGDLISRHAGLFHIHIQWPRRMAA